MKKTSKFIISTFIAVVLILGLMPAQQALAAHPDYPDLIYDNTNYNFKIYSKSLTSDNNGNLMLNFYMENDYDGLYEQSYSISQVLINRDYYAKTSKTGTGNFSTGENWFHVSRGGVLKTSLYISSEDLRNNGIDTIDSIQLTIDNRSIIQLPIRNAKLTEAQYQGDGVYNINGQNKNVLFRLVLGDYNYETMKKIYTLDGSSPMYRLYSPGSGEHLYTANYDEASTLTSQQWQYEGVAWFAPANGSPVYRLFNSISKEHLYTKDEYEKSVREKEADWTYEGVAWYTSESNKPVYRLFHPLLPGISSHHYTLDEYERDTLVKSQGWQYEGISWYGV